MERARELLGAELAALVGESYERAYGDMVRVQQLTELEETVDYSLALALAQGAPPAHPACAASPSRLSVMQMPCPGWSGSGSGACSF